MSEPKGKIGNWEFKWKSVPRGPLGTAQVEVKGVGGAVETLEVRWRRDGDGLWLELPRGVYGFDLESEKNDEGRKTYRVSQRDSDQAWEGLMYLQAGEAASQNLGTAKKKGTRVRAQMPGKIVRVMAKPGDLVNKDQPLLVMEAMKMENEIRAPQPGRVGQVKVAVGQAVESGADLLTLDPPEG